MRAYWLSSSVNSRHFSKSDGAGEEGAVVGAGITATLADRESAAAMEVKLGTPLLRISRKVFDAAGRVVEYIVGLYRPDQYQYRMSLTRVADGDRLRWATD